MPIRYNRAELIRLENLGEDPAVLDAMEDIADEIVERARVLAPKRTGRLAKSIHAELAPADALIGVHLRVGWHKDEFYGLFHELGTNLNPPQPFLRPAAEPFITGQRRLGGGVT